jgi:hypothetical protein
MMKKTKRRDKRKQRGKPMLNAKVLDQGSDYGFELEEAFRLLSFTVVSLDIPGDPGSIRDIGLICGMLTINEEVELVIKFTDELRQYTKSEFAGSLRVIQD